MSIISISSSHCYSESQSNSHYEYDVAFFDKVILTTVTNSPYMVDQWISKTKSIHHHQRLQPLLVGLDTEWHPFVPNNLVAILQLCVGHCCLIFQLLHASYAPWYLMDFLSDYDNIFVDVGVGNDTRKLWNNYSLPVSNTVDLARLAHRKLPMMNVSNPRLKYLVHEVLGVDIEKPRHITMSPWDNQNLSLEQIQYACVDAFVSFEIGRIWRAWDLDS